MQACVAAMIVVYAGLALYLENAYLLPMGRTTGYFNVNSDTQRLVFLALGLFCIGFVQPSIIWLKHRLADRVASLPRTQTETAMAAQMLRSTGLWMLAIVDSVALLGAVAHVATGNLRALVLGILLAVVFHLQVIARRSWLPERLLVPRD